LLSPLYLAVIVLVPTGRLDVVHVAVTGLPPLTGVAPHPVSELQLTVPVIACGCACAAFRVFLRFTSEESPLLTVAVNVTVCPYVEGFVFEDTDTLVGVTWDISNTVPLSVGPPTGVVP
jgi:hypothetical protein